MADRERLLTMVTMLREIETGSWRVTKPFIPPADEAVYRLTVHDGTVGEFNLNAWVRDYYESDDDCTPCGFSACAVGHALLDQRFEFESETYPVYDGKDCWHAVAKYFDIDHGTASHFFSIYGYTHNDVTAADVAARIETWLETCHD